MTLFCMEIGPVEAVPVKRFSKYGRAAASMAWAGFMASEVLDIGRLSWEQISDLLNQMRDQIS